MSNWPFDNTTTTATTNLPATTKWKVRPAMLDTPAFIQIDMLNQTRITGRFTRYSDPTEASSYGAFIGESEDGTVHYVLWAAILRVSVFTLTAVAAPEVPAPTPIPEA